MSLKLRGEDQEFFDTHGPGCVVLFRCVLCGHRTYSHTNPKKSNALIHVQQSSHDCPKCREVFENDPMFARWVLNVLVHNRVVIDRKV